MTTRRLLLAAVILGATGLPGSGAVRAAQTEVVTIDNFSFTPPLLTIPPGTAVTWTNRDDIPHTVFMPDPSQPLKSPPLDTDDQFTFTFAKPGIYKYFCSLHPHMQGTVVVQ